MGLLALILVAVLIALVIVGATVGIISLLTRREMRQMCREGAAQFDDFCDVMEREFERRRAARRRQRAMTVAVTSSGSSPPRRGSVRKRAC